MSSQETLSPMRRIVRIAAKPGQAEAMRAALLDLERATQAESGCREFHFFQALADGSAFLLIEDFADAGALAEHMRLAHTLAFFDRDLAASITPVDPTWLS